ncbi:8726_t:CDS:1 [Funneliformis caledonium]|uniref:8726_t:CDS:1 n=1 Tax=Funneliformis caledonium TaxID=1117310 RepID=A0A9N9B5N5_9GLOM|nr:8726_t:CDS:1 [Funneliformis caledonium]
MYQQNAINTSNYLPQNSQIDSTFNNLIPRQDVQIVNDTYQVSQVSTAAVPLYMNEVQQAMNPSQLSQSTQAYNSNNSDFSFFYCFNFHPYRVNCEEVQLSFETFSQILNNIDNNSTYNVYVFYHEQTLTKKIYKVTCEMISHISMFQFLNKNIYGIEFNQTEQQQQKPSRQHIEYLKLHLRNDLAHYFSSQQIYEEKHFQQSNENTFSNDQYFTPQQDNSSHGMFHNP